MPTKGGPRDFALVVECPRWTLTQIKRFIAGNQEELYNSPRTAAPSEAAARAKEIVVRHLVNVRRLFRSLFHAVQEPEVQCVFTLALTLILIATIFYWLVEGWSLLDAAYFAVVTIATVGFGDFAPQTALGKIFTIGYVFAGIGIFVAAVTALAQAAVRAEPRHPPPE